MLGGSSEENLFSISDMKNLITFLLFVCSVPALLSQVQDQPLTDANEVMAKVLLRDTQRELESGGYVGHRRYVFDNEKMHKHAELFADVSCDSAGTKQFSVITEDGWKAAHKHVLRKMLESETETSTPTIRPKTRLTSDNYTFAMVKSEVMDGRLTYVIDVTPKRRDKYLIEGRVWIDAQDFATVRVEGKPAKNPSFWTRSVQFVQQYRKRGSYWFPSSTLSITEARLFGTTKVNINYFDYQPNSSAVLDATSHPVVHLKGVSHGAN
jgi:hypothetical protein